MILIMREIKGKIDSYIDKDRKREILSKRERKERREVLKEIQINIEISGGGGGK